MIAMVDWLNNYIHMPLSTQSQFFAFIFIPNCFKPIYALLASSLSLKKTFQGRSRAILLQVCGFVSGLLYLATLAVETVPGAFFIFFAINIFNACAELMLGSYLMEIAHRDMGNAGAVQALAGGSRSLGSISAALATMAIYPCDSSLAPDSRKVIAYTGIVAASNFVLAFLLPDTPQDFAEAVAPFSSNSSPKSCSRVNDEISSLSPSGPSAPLREATAPSSCCPEEQSPSVGCERKHRGDSLLDPWVLRLLLVVSLVVSIQAVLIWISVKDLVPAHIFYWVLAALAVVALYIVSFVAKELQIGRNSDRQKPNVGRDVLLKYAIPSLFLFAVNAAPSANESLYTYQFYLFYTSSPCRMTHLSLINSAASVLSFLVYGLACNRQRVRRIILLTSTASLALGLLWLPLTSMHLSDDGDFEPAQGSCVSFPTVGLLSAFSCMDPFVYTAVVSFITSVSTMLAFTPSTVLATESTPLAHKTAAYAVFLSLIDSGDSASGWITSSIVRHLGISYGDWTRLPELIWIATASQVAVLALLVPCLKDSSSSLSAAKNESQAGKGTSESSRRVGSDAEDESYLPLSSGAAVAVLNPIKSSHHISAQQQQASTASQERLPVSC